MECKIASLSINIGRTPTLNSSRQTRISSEFVPGWYLTSCIFWCDFVFGHMLFLLVAITLVDLFNLFWYIKILVEENILISIHKVKTYFYCQWILIKISIDDLLIKKSHNQTQIMIMYLSIWINCVNNYLIDKQALFYQTVQNTIFFLF